MIKTILKSAPQRLLWQVDFRKSDSLYMIDGAILTYPSQGICYEHHLIKDNQCIIEKFTADFYGLPVGRSVEFFLDAEDEGLFTFLEVKFFKQNQLVGQFFDFESKSLKILIIPAHDRLQVRVHVRGKGKTWLKSVRARVQSSAGFIAEGDKKLSENLALMTNYLELQKPAPDPFSQVDILFPKQEILASFAKQDYLLGKFARVEKPQFHFASINGKFEAEPVLQILSREDFSELKTFGMPKNIFQVLQDTKVFDKISLIE